MVSLGARKLSFTQGFYFEWVVDLLRQPIIGVNVDNVVSVPLYDMKVMALLMCLRLNWIDSTSGSVVPPTTL